MSGAMFDNCKLTGANFGEARSLGIRFSQTILANAFLRKMSFRKPELEEMDLTSAGLGGCDFRGAVLERCRLGNAHLSTARFSGADLRTVDLGELSFSSVSNFKGAIISKDQATELLKSLGLGAF